jgi:phenylacetate-CoA ligase
LRRRKVTLLQGYGSATHTLARYCEGVKGLSIRSVVTTAESVTEAQRATIERALGAKVFVDYSASECMRVAFECPCRQGLHVDVGRYWVDVIDPDAGGVGDIVLTRFDNRAHPFIRYRILDRGAITFEPCPCGLRTPRLFNLDGRVLDYIPTPSGAILSLSFFSTIFEKRFTYIQRFQVRQISDDEIMALIEVDRPSAPSDIELMENEIEGVARGSVRAEVRVVDHIPFSINGKKPYIIPKEQMAEAPPV